MRTQNILSKTWPNLKRCPFTNIVQIILKRKSFATVYYLCFFQRELSIIDFTLNYPPIKNNLTSASLLSMLIETDYLNYPPIRNNLTSASLLSMIIEMDYNLLGMKARTVPHCRAEICRARNIFFLSRSTKRCNSVFFRSVICK